MWLDHVRLWALRLNRRLESMLLAGSGWHDSRETEFIASIKQVRLVSVSDDAAMVMLLLTTISGEHKAICVVTELERFNGHS